MIHGMQERAKELRRNQTDAERLLWSLLRNRQLGGFKFRRQKPIGNYIVDFYCQEKKLIIELDGGGHGEEVQAAYDKLRNQKLLEQGYFVLRFWNHQVFQETEAVLKRIWEILNTDPT